MTIGSPSQIKKPEINESLLAQQLANSTSAATRTQVHAGDLKLAVDVIEVLSERGMQGLLGLPPEVRDKEAKKLAQVSLVMKQSSLQTQTQTV